MGAEVWQEAWVLAGHDGSVIDAGRNAFSALTGAAALLAGLLGGLIGYRSDVPWFNTKKGDTWSERQMKRATDFVDRGKGDWSKLWRTLLMSLFIAPLGILFYAEDSFRNFGLLDAARWGS